MAQHNAHVPTPALDIQEKTPISSAFGDVYFSREGGVAETEHVFLSGNGLSERWKTPSFRQKPESQATSRALDCGPQIPAFAGMTPRFHIVELGFGTGLNFVVTLKRFRETAAADATLHYTAIEKYPFTRERLREVLALQPELADEAAELLAAYPLRLPGLHRIHLPRVVLTLCIGDVAEMLAQLTAPVDAWFLDGFSPAKNAEMWSEEVLTHIGRLSVEGTSVATFTVAGHVRRGLEAAGFTIEKAPGFGSKREMLKGVVSRHSLVVSTHDSRLTAHDCIVIGAGIAGCTLARALAERGQRVMVLEKHTVARGGSGNTAGVLFPQLTKQWNVASAWHFTAYGLMLRQLARWKKESLIFASESPGMLRLPRHEEEEQQLQKLSDTWRIDPAIVHWLSREKASVQAGVELPSGAAFFSQGTWVSPPELCCALLQHKNIMLCEETEVSILKREGGGWVVMLASGEQMRAKSVCVASAAESAKLLADYGLRLNEVGGQVSEIAAANGAAKLRSIVCRKGYVIPCGENYVIGATYHREDFLAVTEARHDENLSELKQLLPRWDHGAVIAGRSSVRATTPDRLPYVGMLDAGLYVSTGHGSRGLLSAPLAAEIIASIMQGETLPVTQELIAAVNPLRFKK